MSQSLLVTTTASQGSRSGTDPSFASCCRHLHLEVEVPKAGVRRPCRSLDGAQGRAAPGPLAAPGSTVPGPPGARRPPRARLLPPRSRVPPRGRRATSTSHGGGPSDCTEPPEPLRSLPLALRSATGALFHLPPAPSITQTGPFGCSWRGVVDLFGDRDSADRSPPESLALRLRPERPEGGAVGPGRGRGGPSRQLAMDAGPPELRQALLTAASACGVRAWLDFLWLGRSELVSLTEPRDAKLEVCEAGTSPSRPHACLQGAGHASEEARQTRGRRACPAPAENRQASPPDRGRKAARSPPPRCGSQERHQRPGEQDRVEAGPRRHRTPARVPLRRGSPGIVALSCPQGVAPTLLSPPQLPSNSHQQLQDTGHLTVRPLL